MTSKQNSFHNLWPSIRKHVLSTKAFFRGLRSLWNPFETLLKPFGNALETCWNPLETLLKHFETLWKPFLKRFETLWNVEALWKPLRNVLHALWKAALKMLGEKIILLGYIYHPHGGECTEALHVIIFLFAEMLFCLMIRYWFICGCGKIKSYDAWETSKFSGEKFWTYANRSVNRLLFTWEINDTCH